MTSPSDNEDSTFSSPSDRTWRDSDLDSVMDVLAGSALIVEAEGFEILRRLGSGSQGDVYLAFEKTAERKVALKVLRAMGPSADNARKRFDREIKTIARLRHPNIVSLLRSDWTKDGRLFYAMDYVAGSPLNEHVRDHRFSIQDALILMAEVCDGVAYASSHGIVHRDLKPSNIMVDGQGTPLILDFGLAKPVMGTGGMGVSLPDAVLGTVRYMAPEQAAGRGEEVDARTDVYALGVILYELLTGAAPFSMDGSLTQVLRRILEDQPKPPSSAWSAETGLRSKTENGSTGKWCPIEPELDTVVLMALAKEKGRRYHSAAELAIDIRRYLAGDSIQARRQSISYQVGARVRSLVRRHRVTTFLATSGVAWLLALWIGIPLVYRWTRANVYFQKLAFTLLNEGVFTKIDHVRIIGLTDTTDFQALARREGITGVDPADGKSLRRLHGRLMEKLANSGCRVLVWDFRFEKETEHDAHFVRGVEAMQEAGIDVVVGVEHWQTTPDGLPGISEAFANDVRWGAMTIDLRDIACAQLIARRSNGVPQPALALQAYAAFRAPGSNVNFTIDLQNEEIHLRYWRPHPTIPDLQPDPYQVDRIRVSRVCNGAEEIGEFNKGFAQKLGLDDEATVGFFLFGVPADETLRESTVDYESVMTADSAALQRWFEGKVVIIGELRQDYDKHTMNDGRVVSGCYGHLAAMEALIRDVSVRLPLVKHRRLTPLAGALLGAFIAIAPLRRRRRWTFGVIGLTLFALISVVAIRQYQFLLNPLLPSLGLLFALLVAVGARKALDLSLAN